MYRESNLPKYVLSRFLFVIISILCINNACWAGNKPSVEEAFLQGQQYVEQANMALAEVSLTRIPPASPYAKLLAGNIAAQNGDADRTFLLLLPLQSNNTLIKPAAASLHASLSSAYQKQGDSFNVLDQLIRREAYLESTAAIDSNQAAIWQLLSALPLEDLITMRGESTDTTTQGWIDLSLAARNQNVAAGLSTWGNSYPDHVALSFSKTLNAASSKQAQTPVGLSTSGNIALILPFDNETFAAKANAFKLGLQTALTKYGIPNQIKTYASVGDQESFGDLYAFAQDEGATYVIGPMLKEELPEAKTNVHAITLLDSTTAGNASFQHVGLSLRDETQAITAFATRNAIQHIAIVTTDSEDNKLMLADFQAVWQTELGYEVEVINLAQDLKSGDASLLDLKGKVSEKPHDMVLLAMSANEARVIRPYLDISTPTVAFSSIHDIDDINSNAALNAVRFVDLPFLLDKDNAQFSYYRSQSTELNSNELLRWFALGVDSLQLLIAGTQAADREIIINGLTGKLTIDKTGHFKRELSMARFSYDGVILEK